MDDLGWGDLSATSGQFPTLNMDWLYYYIHLMLSAVPHRPLRDEPLDLGEFIP